MEKNKNLIYKDNYKINKQSENIKFNNVEFSYFNSDDRIFNKLDLEIPKNSHTLVMGPNGSGKSTLLGLISGIYFPSKGEVNIFSNKLGFIGPNPLIFDGTLMSNIQYGNENKLDEELVIKYLKDLETFKEENNYDLTKQITNKTAKGNAIHYRVGATDSNDMYIGDMGVPVHGIVSVSVSGVNAPTITLYVG